MIRNLIILALFSVAMNSYAQENTFTVDTIHINSQVLKEKRSVIRYKPLNIKMPDSVKVLYLLEGEYSNHLRQEIHKRYKDSISNLIIVGIVNPTRRRDMLHVNGAGDFLGFITKEVIPAVEKDYKTAVRILNGHSFCGSFTMFAMIQQPGYFDYFIATSPTPIMKLIDKATYQKIDSLSQRKIVFYISFGSKDMGQVRKWVLRLRDNLTGLKFSCIEWKIETLEGKNHNNSDVLGLLNGLNGLKK